jgi:hypothetical protein
MALDYYFWSSMAKLHPKEKQLLCYLLAFKQRVPNKKSSLQDKK